MKRIFSLSSILVLFLFLPGKAQLILPSTNNGFDKYPNFNFDYIKSHRIKTITFDIIDKKDMEVAVDKGLIHNYEFDKEGRLIRFYYTVISKTVVKEYRTKPVYRHRRKISNGGIIYKNEYEYDTISTRFYYDEMSRLKLKRYNDGIYYEATYYDYNTDGQVIREMRAKETNSSGDKSMFMLGVQNILSEEKFEYQKTGERQYKKKCLNDEGRIFKEIIVNVNEKGQPLLFNESFTVTWISQETKFIYNDKFQLVEKNYSSNSGGQINIKDTYEYDERGNILTEKQYKSETLLNELSYLFDEADNKVKSFLNRDHVNKSIRITKVYYSFY
ncbi:MAG: hypothetical protein ACJ76F_04740 [Bacteroidia bacterium]